MKHNHRRISRDAFRIAFELSNYPETPYKVWRIRTEQGGHSFHLEGLVLEPTSDGTHAVVAHARAGDVVMVTHHPRDGVTPPHRGFLIGNSLEPRPLTDLSRCYERSTTTDGPLIDFDGKRFLHLREDDLREFLRAKHPAWLEAHVNATLRLWRTEAPDLFANVAPPRWVARKLWLLASHDPRRALEEYPHLYKGDLKSYCIRRMLAPVSKAVAQALPSKVKPARRSENAEYLLESQHAELTDDQLRACARTNPRAALQLFPRIVDPRRQAILLSCAFPPAWTNRALLRSEDFRNAILDSLCDHYEEWMISNPEGLTDVLKTISVRLQLPPTADELVRMLERYGPEGRLQLSEYIARQI